MLESTAALPVCTMVESSRNAYPAAYLFNSWPRRGDHSSVNSSGAAAADAAAGRELPLLFFFGIVVVGLSFRLVVVTRLSMAEHDWSWLQFEPYSVMNGGMSGTNPGEIQLN